MNSIWWFVGAALLGIAEIFTLDLTLLMLGGGALAGGAVALLGGPWVLSAVVALAVSAMLLFALRPWLLRALRARGEVIETNTAALIGHRARTLDEITETSGRIKLRGEVWTARIQEDAQPIPQDQHVTVITIKGATAVVEPEKE